MKTKAVLLLTVLLLSVATGFAQTSGDFGEDNALHWELELVNGTLTISGTGAIPDYDIGHDVPWDSYLPLIRNVIIEYGVARIGNHAFAFCDMIHLVTIPESVTNIGVGAFQHCVGLVDITIPNSVESIGDMAFNYCNNLAAVNIPISVTSIGHGAFYYCNRLTAINVDENNDYYTSANGVLFNKEKTTLIQYPAGKTDTDYTVPESVTSISEQAFNGCSSLTEVIIPEGVTDIGLFAFYNCLSLTSMTIPNSVTSIGYNAFNACSNMTDIIVKDGNEYYSSHNGVLFNKNKTTLVQYPVGKTEADYTIPESVIRIYESAFSNCRSLASVNIPGSVTGIGNNAFNGCRSLASVNIPNSVESIGSYAFYQCGSLASVTVPNSVTSIGDGAFADCSSLEDITVGWSVPLSINANVFSEVTTAEVNLHVPEGTEDLYRADAVWGGFKIESIPNVLNVTGVSLDQTELSLTVDATGQLTSTVLPDNADNKAVVWTSSNEGVATVADGLVTAIAAGAATITVTTEDGEFTATCAVTVMHNPVPVTGISLDVTKLSLQKPFTDTQLTHQLTATVLPEDADNKNVTWTSDNPSVVSVSQTGLLTTQPDMTGKAIITATTEDGAFSATCAVTVTDFREETVWNDNIGKLSLYSTLLTLQNAINDGYIIITLPAGLSLSADATRVNEAYLTLGEITQISENQWRIELSPLSYRPHRSVMENSEPELLIEIGYTASESTADGNYEVIIDTLELTFADGTTVKEEEIPVTVNVNRAGTAIANVIETQLIVSVQNNVLKIGGLSAGDVFSVYNVQGILIYKGTATASEASVNLPSRGVYIVATDKERAKVFYSK